jgi:hypothetical protein
MKDYWEETADEQPSETGDDWEETRPAESHEPENLVLLIARIKREEEGRA